MPRPARPVHHVHVLYIPVLAEPFLDVVVGWIPMYYLAKSVLLGYLGPMGGATMVYKNFVRDLLKKHEAAIDAGVARAEARAREAAARATEAGKDVAAKATSTAQRMAAEQAMKSRTD